MKRTYALIAALFVSGATHAAEPIVPKDMEADVTFASVNGMDLKLDIVQPTVPSVKAAIIFLHGGGWRAGTKDGMRRDAVDMAAKGYVGIPAQYRLLGQAPWPAQLEDVKAAIRWTRANAGRLKIDPDRIIVWGGSSGAHLALMAGATPSDAKFEGNGGNAGVSSAVAAVIAMYPPTKLVMNPAPGAGKAQVLLGDAATEAAGLAASPTEYARKDFPPTLLLHGTEDTTLSYKESLQMFEALKAAGAKADLHLFHGHNHGFTGLPSLRPSIAAEVAYFLDRTVIDPKKYTDEMEKLNPFSRPRAAQPTPPPAATAR